MILEFLQTLLIGALVSLAVYVVSVVLRNQRAHRFFQVRSPYLPKIPNLSVFSGHALDVAYGGQNWKNLEKYHAELGRNICGFIGDIPVMSCIDLDLIKRMVIDEPDEHPNRTKLILLAEQLEVDSVPFSEDDQWRRIRKAVAPAFASHKIKSANVQAEIKSVIDKLVAAIERRLDGRTGAIEVDADDLFHRYALSLVFTCFYKQNNLIDFDAEVDPTTDADEKITSSLNNPLLKLCIIFPILRPFLNWLVKNFHPQARLRTKIMNFIKQQTELHHQAQERINSARDRGKSIDEDIVELSGGQKFRRNMVDYIIDQYRLGKLTAREYLHSSFFLYFAANKTSADALSKIFYLLAANQDVQDKLRTVIISEGADAEYLNWVILESMRVYPPALLGCSRTITKDFQTCDGHLVPKGTFVVTPTFSIHRLKEYWGEDADEFRPERWANSKSFHPCQYLAFGAGKRNCPGKDFAMHEMRLLLAELLVRFKFDKSPKSEGFLSFASPALIFMISDKPTYIKISRLPSA